MALEWTDEDGTRVRKVPAWRRALVRLIEGRRGLEAWGGGWWQSTGRLYCVTHQTPAPTSSGCYRGRDRGAGRCLRVVELCYWESGR